jgi:hypothetical protein
MIKNVIAIINIFQHSHFRSFSSSVYDRMSICENLDGLDEESGGDMFPQTSTAPLINRDIVTQKTRIFNNSSVRTSNLALSLRH